MRFFLIAIFCVAFLAAGAAHSAMHLSDDGEGEVLIFPFYTSAGADTSNFEIVNNTGFVKAVKLRFRDGLGAADVLGFHLYLGPYDTYQFSVVDAKTVDEDPVETGGAAVASGDSNCTVPKLGTPNLIFDGYTDEQGRRVQPFVNYEYSSNGNSSIERTLTGYVEAIEMGQWDPFQGEKGPAAAQGALGNEASCDTLTAAWVNGVWSDTPADEALSWRGGGLSGSATIQTVAGAVQYEAVAISEFARYQFSGEYHTVPGDRDLNWPAPGLNSASHSYEEVIGGSLVRQSAAQGRDAVSALLSKTVIKSEAPATGNSIQSWIISFPTKYFHTKYSSWLGPFSEIWNASLSQSCDFVEVGSYSSTTEKFTKVAEADLCAATNLLNTSSLGEAPISFPYWLTSSPRPQTTPGPTALRTAYRSSTSVEVDRSVYVDSNYDSDTRIVGLPMIAIPIYFDSAGEVKSGDFSTTTTRIYERLTVSLREAAYTSSSAIIQLDASNLSGFDVTSYAVACDGDGKVVEASSTSASLTVSPLVAGERYLCEAVAHTATGQGKTSDEFPVQIAIAPAPPLVSKTDFEEGTILLYVTAEDNGSAITEFTATCRAGNAVFSSVSSSSPIVVDGLDSETAYTCSVTATNGVGVSSPSATTAPIVPEAISAGLPIWLLYEASK
jgi:hypothetical protein